MKKNKLNRIYVILLVLIAALPMACKKETPNDPNIDDRTINKTIVATASGSNFVIKDSLDFDLDGAVDLQLIGIIDDSVQAFIISAHGGSLLTEQITILGSFISTNAQLSSGVVLDASSLSWTSSSYASYNSTRVGLVGQFGIHGKGDQFIGFRLNKTAGNYLYGWIKVNLSDDSKTLIIKELAVQKVINKAIKVGEK